ncbi:thioredoxin domain-containing protein [bacterium]|nr:thioredoxin domain-containing protein [bacterium]
MFVESIQSIQNRQMMLNTQTLLLGILAVLLIVFILCKYKNKSPTQLFEGFPNFSSLNFGNSTVKSSEKLTLNTDNQVIFMYADWCGHCQSFKPEWEAFEGWCKNNGVTCKAINGGDESNAPLVQKYGVEGFPTVLKCDKQGNKLSEHVGERNKDALIAFISE